MQSPATGAVMNVDLSELAGPETSDPGVIRLDLNTGANSPVPDPQRLAAMIADIRHYGAADAHPLRARLAEMLSRRHRRQLSPANIALDAGSMALLREAVADAVDVNSPVVTFNPGYRAMRRLTHALGGDVVSLPRTIAGGIPVASVVTAVSGAAAPLIVLNHPINPTGQGEDLDAIEVLLTALPRAVVLIDEAYWEYSTHPSALDAVADLNRVVVVRTFSKARGLAGIRLGYAVSDPDRVVTWRNRSHPGAVSAVTQTLGIWALDEPESAFAHRIGETVGERERMADAIRTTLMVDPLDSCTNFLFIPLDSQASVVHTWLREQGIWVRLITDEPGLTDGIRVSVSTPVHNSFFIDTLSTLQGRI